jgi:hypothetical protein
MIGLLSVKRGDYTEARDALTRFSANALVGQNWRGLAQRLLRDMSTAEVER